MKYNGAQTYVKAHPIIELAFADINCRLGMKPRQGGFMFFNTKDELKNILN